MSREEIEGLSERLLSFANHIDRKRCAEATETDADNARDAAQALTALLAENERLREAASEGLICAEADLEQERNERLERGDDPEADPTFQVFRWRRDLIAAALNKDPDQ